VVDEVIDWGKMAKIQEYSIGFMFTKDMKQVLLIKKGHGPKCVVGRWNGIGGHIEPGETPIQCQVREFHEETGVQTVEDQWAKFTELRGEDFVVHCFWGCNNSAVLNARTMTDEPVEIVNTKATGNQHIHNMPLAPNLRWFIPFLMDKSTMNHLCVVLATYCKDDDLDVDSTATI